MKKEIPWNLIIQKLKHDITAEEEHDLTRYKLLLERIIETNEDYRGKS